MSNCGSVKLTSFSSNVRRIQMSFVVQSVRTTAPGVSFSPNPAGPFFQEDASNSGFIQSPDEGFSVVYCHSCGVSCDVASTVVNTGGGRYSFLCAATSTPGSILITSRSYVISPFTSISTSVVCVYTAADNPGSPMSGRNRWMRLT